MSKLPSSKNGGEKKKQGRGGDRGTTCFVFCAEDELQCIRKAPVFFIEFQLEKKKKWVDTTGRKKRKSVV